LVHQPKPLRDSRQYPRGARCCQSLLSLWWICNSPSLR
jgi:hypothetical protein